jgi:hypothetical protein
MPKRGDTTARGYGTRHQKLRAQIKPYVEAGQANCWRCGRAIHPGMPWDLGHDDDDRTQYRGPEHVKCNRATRNRQHKPQHPSHGVDTSRDW